MQNLSELNVEQCNNLEYLSSVDVAKSFVELWKLDVSECRSLEVIFKVNKKQDGDEEDGTSLSEKLLLSQLRILSLRDLPNLKTFCGTFDKEKTQLGEQQPLFNGTVHTFIGLFFSFFTCHVGFFCFYFCTRIKAYMVRHAFREIYNQKK